MSDRLRGRRLNVGQWVRANKIFRYDIRREELYFLKLFGCMLCEAKANGHEVPIDLAPFSEAIMSGRPHPEVHLQFGRCDGTIGRSNLHCWTTQHGSILAGWLYELDSIAVSVLFAHADRIGPIYGIQNPTRVQSASRLQMLCTRVALSKRRT